MHENRLQSRPSQGYLIANAPQITYSPRAPDHALDLSAPSCLAVPASEVFGVTGRQCGISERMIYMIGAEGRGQ
jgi:hypothetical protein